MPKNIKLRLRLLISFLIIGLLPFGLLGLLFKYEGLNAFHALLITIGTSLFFWLIISKNLFKQISVISSGLNNMIKTKHAGRIELKSNDEISEIAQNINLLVEDMSKKTDAYEDKMLQFYKAFENISDAVLICGTNGEFIYTNKTWNRIFGYSLNELKNFQDLNELVENKNILNEILQELAKGFTWSGELKMRDKKNNLHIISLRVDNVFDSEGVKTGFIGVYRDITDEVHTEQAVIESEAKVYTIMNLVNDCVLTISWDGTIESISASAEKIFGYANHELIGENVKRILYNGGVLKEKDKSLLTFLKEDKEKVIEKNFETLANKRNGDVFPICLSVSELIIGKRSVFVLVVNDLTKKRIQNTGVVSDDKSFHKLIDTLPDGVLITDEEMKIVYLNPAMVEILDIENDYDGLAVSFYKFIHPDYHQVERERIFELQKKDVQSYFIEEKIIKNNGEIIDVEILAQKNINKDSVYFNYVIRDITESKIVKESLRNYSLRLKALFEIQKTILTGETTYEIVDTALKYISFNLISVLRTSVILFDYSRNTGVIYAVNAYRPTELKQGMKISIDQLGDLENLRSNNYKLVKDLMNHSSKTEADTKLLLEGVRSYLTLPLLANGELIGTLNFGTSEPDGFSKETIDLAKDIANELAIAVKHSLMQEKLQDIAKLPNENPFPVYRISSDYYIIYSNKGGKEILKKWSLQKGMTVPAWLQGNIEFVLQSEETKTIETMIDEDRYFEFVLIPVKEKHYVNVYGFDITQKKKAEESLILASKVFESSNEAIIITNEKGKILDVNSAFTAATGYDKEEVLGEDPNVMNSGKHDKKFFEHFWRMLKDTGQWQGEIWDRRKNGEIFPKWLSVSALTDKKGKTTHYVGIFTDITKMKQTEEYIQYLSDYDTLTGLPNRNLFIDRLKQAILHASRNDKIAAVMFLNLDRFKIINDTLGHGAGDQLLSFIAKRITENVRESDTVARLSGDEFIISVSNLLNVQGASVVSEKIISSVSKPFTIKGHELFISCSLGIALYPHDGKEVEVLMKNADTAMHHAKEHGKNNYQFFSEEMNVKAFERLTMESSMRKALENEEFIVYYQPKINIEKNKVIGMEALVRWQHPELGIVSPAKFIPLAEETGLIVPLGEYVLRKACKFNRHLQINGFEPMIVSVNLSALQFNNRSQLITVLKSALDDSGLHPKYLELELTESIIMQDAEYIIESLSKIKEMGIFLSIDDFGTGYSSLSYIKRFPIDTLKIDRSFVKDILVDPEDAAIAKTIIALAHNLNLNVIAEGVDDIGQLEFLLENECKEIQGYLYSQPVPEDQFEELIKKPVKFSNSGY